MPRIPRDVSGAELARKLGAYGYQVTRQTGSHMRLTRNKSGSDLHVTIPRHSALRVGTLNGILTEVAVQLEKSKEDLIRGVFG
ncbi:MAG: type II toxin-antitoxin system HicA family toxin [Thermoguttaceae bacterium]